MSVKTFPRLDSFVVKKFPAQIGNVLAYRGSECGKFRGKAAGLRTKSPRPSGLLQVTPKTNKMKD